MCGQHIIGMKIAPHSKPFGAPAIIRNYLKLIAVCHLLDLCENSKDIGNIRKYFRDISKRSECLMGFRLWCIERVIFRLFC